MSTSFDQYQKRKLISSYFSVVISIALVLFLLGCLGLLVLNAKKVADHFREQVVVTIYLNDSAKEVEVNQLQKSLAMAEYTKEAKYVSKEEAAQIVKTDIGEDFMEFLGANPLQNSIDVYLKADYVTNETLDGITEELSNKAFIEDITYDNDLVEIMNNNVRKITFWVLILSAVFTLIAVLLINSSIRLAVYSKRFIIKTMQMVGATKRFIRKPFVLKSIQLGVIGAFVALIGMGVVLYYLDKTFPELELMQKPILVGGLFVAVFLLGIIITWISTFIATQRFLNLKTDQLYY
ncbi:cell division protein FtsX [Psychroserpens sp.]|uniref:cell division protein FtsX n=1 Tax=Psychroserpens sp. TaxID=2020870 RepID=UPI001B0DA443|nr:permease-like cell division protein FtsX [Psychroserpens sp.]MBO6605631.1 ABC transporter permease [Psychroserpens sp.]MBO6653560.1 ABC transporter permease [Psychroserpens sp.]MBO6681881.1 ABC transporter permease [Psychroserpens sp.]MBO6749005.1 ABC transporter permease [Psychroserpens sp.]MBO6915524.1 ABC transporter permease [Psychroserpens sp.]